MKLFPSWASVSFLGLSRLFHFVIAAFCFWLATADVAHAQLPVMLAEKSWAIGYILVGLCIFMGLLAVCIPRVRRIEAPDEEPAKQQVAQGAAPGRPGQFGQQPYGQQPYGQQPYGQMGQRPGFGPQPGFGQQPRPAQPVHAGGGALKSRKVAGLLGIFLGGWGIHRFYLGHGSIGAIMIVVTLVTCGMGAWWGVIEGIMILSGGGVDRDGEGRPLGP